VRTPGGYPIAIEAIYCEPSNNRESIVRNPPGGGTRTVTYRHQQDQSLCSNSGRSRSSVTPRAPQSSNAGERCNKPGRDQRCRHQRQAARAAQERLGTTGVIASGKPVPSKVRSHRLQNPLTVTPVTEVLPWTPSHKMLTTPQPPTSNRNQAILETSASWSPTQLYSSSTMTTLQPVPAKASVFAAN
jgi:hypothetical protein